MTMLLRPDDISAKGVPLVDIPASEGAPYSLEYRRRGGVMRLARQQDNGAYVSIVFSPSDAIAVGDELAAWGRMRGADQ